MHARSTLIALALLAAGASAQANNLLDQLKEKAGEAAGASSAGSQGSAGGSALGNLGFKMPAIGSSTIGNAAGVLQYCVKNNYLSADAASGVKDKLMGMITGQKQQQTGYANGAKGLLMGDDGKSLNLKGISGKLKTKACDYVLKNASSLV